MWEIVGCVSGDATINFHYFITEYQCHGVDKRVQANWSHHIAECGRERGQ